MDGRRDGIRDHEEVLVLLTLQSTPSGLLLALNASTDQPNRVWLSVEGLGNAFVSPELVDPWRGEDGRSYPRVEVSQGSFLLPNMLNARFRVATCLGLLDSSGCVLLGMKALNHEPPEWLPRRLRVPMGSKSSWS